MRSEKIWLGFAIALVAIAGFLAAPSMTTPVYADESKADTGTEDGNSTGMGDPDMPDAGKDPNTGQGPLRYERVDSGRQYNVRPQPGMTEVTRIAQEPVWKQWLRALGVLFGTRIGWF